MSKKEILIPIALIGLALVFGLVSTMVLVSRGHPGWIKRKLKIGSMILTLTATLNTSLPGCGNTHMVTCYDPVSYEFIVLVDKEDTYLPIEITVDLKTDPVLRGQLKDRQSSSFVYRIRDQDLTQVQGGLLQALDGAWDEHHEEFEIVLTASLDTGTYRLELAAGTDPAEMRNPVEYFLHIQND